MKTPPQKRKLHSEVQMARGRLRGALNETLHSAELAETAEEEVEDDLPQSHYQKRPSKNLVTGTGQLLLSPRSSRPYQHPAPLSTFGDVGGGVAAESKRRKRELTAASVSQLSKVQAESFVMKLFDRSLDLSKYSEQTSLYPICRAWMANQPRNANIPSYRERRSPSPIKRADNAVELLTKLRRGDLRDIRAMPAPKEAALPKIPPPDVELKDTEKTACSKEQMVAQWKQVKANWMQHTKSYQKRYELNHSIIQELFKP